MYYSPYLLLGDKRFQIDVTEASARRVNLLIKVAHNTSHNKFHWNITLNIYYTFR